MAQTPQNDKSKISTGTPYLKQFVGTASAVTSLYLAKKLTETFPQKLWTLTHTFEERSPFAWGKTFGLSSRVSSYGIDRVELASSRFYNKDGGLTSIGQKLWDLSGNKINLSTSQSFTRAGQGAWLESESLPGFRVRFASGSAWSQAGQEINSGFNKSTPLRGTLKQKAIQFYKQQQRSTPDIKYTGDIAIKDTWDATNRWVPIAKDEGAFRNVINSVQHEAMWGVERAQRLFSHVGLGLEQGTYDKAFHIPFAKYIPKLKELVPSEGGWINQFLTKRILPAYLAYTGIRYLDYLTKHVVGNKLVELPFNLNIIRAKVTDNTPGGRYVTDGYKKVVPGPQYGPVALPLAGAFVGGLIHYGNVLRGKYASQEVLKDAEGRILPSLRNVEGRLIPSLEEAKGLLSKRSWPVFKALPTPAKGLVAGFALMLPFLPGMLGSRHTSNELQDIYTGKQKVADRKGRWWEVGRAAWSGTGIQAWRPHWLVIHKAHAAQISLYGSEKEYWKHNGVLYPYRKYISDPYFLEKKHYEDRPYPVTSPAFSNVPLLGPALAATIGKLIKPVVRMHPEQERETDPRVKDEFSAVDTINREGKQASELVGLPGFGAKTLYDKLLGPSRPDVYEEGSRQLDSTSRSYFDKNLGAIPGISPSGAELFGYSEGLRRIIQNETNTVQVNNIPNSFQNVKWLPNQFKTGDPYTSISSGNIRLPGEGYAALNQEVQGLAASDYPDINRLEILSDIAPNSMQFRSYLKKLRKSSNADLRWRAEVAAAQAEKTQNSWLDTKERKYTAPTESINGTIESVTDDGRIKLKEYKGHNFTLSGTAINMSDIAAASLGQSTEKAIRNFSPDKIRDKLHTYLKPGSSVNVKIQEGGLSNRNVRGVFFSNSGNVNKKLLFEDELVPFNPDNSGAEGRYLASPTQRLAGSIAEQVSFTGERDLATNFLPTPFHTKFWNVRTALSRYRTQELMHEGSAGWSQPIKDYIKPYIAGTAYRIAGVERPSQFQLEARKLKAAGDILTWLRSKNPDTMQYDSSFYGVDLSGNPSVVAHALPTKERPYFLNFVKETDPEKRQEILSVASPNLGQAIVSQWEKEKYLLAQANGENPDPIFSDGRLITEENLQAYHDSKSNLSYGDYVRSQEVKQDLAKYHFNLPDANSEIYDPDFDVRGAQIKLLENDGYDHHEFGFFDPSVWRLFDQPKYTGAVQELTAKSGKSSIPDQVSLESYLIQKGNNNPNLLNSSSYSDEIAGSLNIRVNKNNTEQLKQDRRRRPENYKSNSYG